MATAKTKAAAANRAKAGSAASIVKAQNEKTFRSSMPSVTTPSASQNRTNVTLMNAQGQTKTVPQNTAAYNLYTSKGFSEPKPDKFNPDIGQLTPAERIGNKALEPITRVDEKTNQLFGGGKTPAPKTFEEWEKMKARELKRDQEATTKLSEKEAELAMKSDLMGVEDLKKSQKAGMENLKAVYGTDREGGVSTGNQMLPGAYKAGTQGRITLAEQQAQLATDQRDKILSDLRKAQENDQKELAKTLLGQLDLAEQEIAKYDERVASIENTRANTQKIQQETTLSNMEAMGSAIGNLTVPELQKMGEGAGFTMPQMLTFQKAYQLRAEADESKNQAEADYKRAQAEELIQSVKWQAEDRPLDVRFKEAETKIKEAEANGVILDPKARLEYVQALAEYTDSLGQGEVYLPSGTKYPVTPTGTGISVGVKEGDPTGWCGAFINDLLGDRIIGNTYEQKISLINSQTPVVGAVGVMASPGDYAKYGHVVMVEKINPDGTLSIVESNGLNPMKAGRRNIPVTSFDGFIIPGSSKPINTAGSKGLTSYDVAVFNSFDGKKIPDSWTGSKKEFIEQYKTFNNTKKDPNTDLSTLLSMTNGGKPLTTGAEEQLNKFDMTNEQLNEIESSLGKVKTDKLNPLLAAINSKNPYATKVQAINAQLQAIIPGLARGVYGEVGVLTDQDIENYRKTIPNLKQTKDVQRLVLDMTRKIIQRGAEKKLRSLASTYDISGYEYLVRDLISPSQQTDEIDEYLQSVQSKPVAPEEDSLINSELDNYFSNR